MGFFLVLNLTGRFLFSLVCSGIVKISNFAQKNGNVNV